MTELDIRGFLTDKGKITIEDRPLTEILHIVIITGNDLKKGPFPLQDVA
jgi:hypothetical protein